MAYPELGPEVIYRLVVEDSRLLSLMMLTAEISRRDVRNIFSTARVVINIVNYFWYWFNIEGGQSLNKEELWANAKTAEEAMITSFYQVRWSVTLKAAVHDGHDFAVWYTRGGGFRRAIRL